jgi:molybdopterin-binding protein
MVHVRSKCLFDAQRHFRRQRGLTVQQVGKRGAAHFQDFRRLRHAAARSRSTAIDSTFAGGGFILFGMTLSARNRLAGEIVELEFGGVMAHVVVRVGQDLIESVITKRSAEEMKLKIGDKVSAVIKSTEVMLEKS